MDTEGKEQLYLFVGLLFLMQHIKLPIARTSSRSKPTTSDTIKTTRRPSVQRTHNPTHWLPQYSFTAQGWACNFICPPLLGNKMYCNVITSFVQANGGIPLNECLFVLIGTEHNCLKVHEKSTSQVFNLGEKQWRQAAWSLEGQPYTEADTQTVGANMGHKTSITYLQAAQTAAHCSKAAPSQGYSDTCSHGYKPARDHTHSHVMLSWLTMLQNVARLTNVLPHCCCI